MAQIYIPSLSSCLGRCFGSTHGENIGYMMVLSHLISSGVKKWTKVVVGVQSSLDPAVFGFKSRQVEKSPGQSLGKALLDDI